MPQSSLLPVEFHGATLYTVSIDGAHHVALRPIVQALGLDWAAQFTRIKRHPVLSTCVVVTATQVPGDDQARDMFFLPLDKLNGWLFGVSVNRVKPELRERLTQYQRECFDVLARHFLPTTPYAVLPGQTLSAEQAQTLRELLTTSVKRLPHDKQASAMVKGWSKLKAHFGTDYRHIPASEFAEALSIIARHVAESAIADEAPTLRNRRWLIATDREGRETVQPVGPHDFISNWADLTRGIADGSLLPSTSELIDLATACMQRVQRRPAIYRRSDVPGVLTPV